MLKEVLEQLKNAQLINCYRKAFIDNDKSMKDTFLYVVYRDFRLRLYFYKAHSYIYDTEYNRINGGVEGNISVAQMRELTRVIDVINENNAKEGK